MVRRNRMVAANATLEPETDIAISLVGVTEGREVFTISQNAALPPDNWVEITPLDAALSADHDVYVVRRQMYHSKMMTWIGAYRPALEIRSNRPANYYGVGLWLVGHPSNLQGADLLTVLRALRKDLLELAITDGRFTRRLTDLNVLQLQHVDGVADNLQRIYESLQPGLPPHCIPFIPELSNAHVDATDGAFRGVAPQWLLEWALDGAALFGRYSRVVIHTCPATLTAVHRNSLPNLISLYELRKMVAKPLPDSHNQISRKKHISRKNWVSNGEAAKLCSTVLAPIPHDPRSYPEKAKRAEQEKVQALNASEHSVGGMSTGTTTDSERRKELIPQYSAYPVRIDLLLITALSVVAVLGTLMILVIHVLLY